MSDAAAVNPVDASHDHTVPLHPQVALRSPEAVMRLERMGSFFPTRLSFMRTVIRTLQAGQADVRRPVWEIDNDGYGRAVYSVTIGGHVYSLVAFSTRLDPDRRTDRVIAEAWDSSYVLFDGTPTAADLDRLEVNAPRQEAGRFAATDLVLSRANKSVRLFEHVAERLASGQQPDETMVGSIGYLMRTTAVYGNGKFGIADRARFANRPHMSDPFRAELLTVWLIRGFTHDLVEHVAQRRNPDAFVPLDRRLKRHLGVGNSTGLGMAPFLVSHPILINNWMLVRETALARVRAIETPTAIEVNTITALLARCRRHVDEWNVDDDRQTARILALRSELADVEALLTEDWIAAPSPWDRLVDVSDQWSIECQELIVALLIEPYGSLVDGLATCMASSTEPRLRPAMSVGELRNLVTTAFDWALDIDFDARDETSLFWYVSEEKLEPRLGHRYEEPGAELEQPLDIARRVQKLHRALEKTPSSNSVAAFLLEHPEHRFATRRVQTLEHHPYAEIRDNMISSRCLPIDMLRSKLSFFGASKFDPRSDRWTRITMYQGAPLFDDVSAADADDWWLPVLEPS